MLGDAYGAGIVHHLSKGDLERMDEEDRRAKAENQDSEDDVKSADAMEMDSLEWNIAAPADSSHSEDNGHVNSGYFSEKM